MSSDGSLFPSGEPPISGEVQFWRMDPDTWERALRAVRDLGIGTIATYLSWRRHEPEPGTFDLRGRHGPELDVHRFLELCREVGLRVILKPGPWICAEEPGGGFPDWLLADDSLIALDYQGKPVSGYNPPFKHPMPSYASTVFRSHVARWIRAVWADLKDFTGPDGPVIATQYDNEPSLGFQDTMYGFDHHPDALTAWHTFAGPDVQPPRPRTDGPTGVTAVERTWATWQRHYIAEYLGWVKETIADAGAPQLIGTVNLNTHPVRGWPQDGGVIADTLQDTIVGEDHYFIPPLDEHDLTGLALAAAQARTTNTPLIWAPEMQAGIWRSPGEEVSYPDPTTRDLLAWWGAALALGYQGFNLYMLVNRENWELAPLANDGAITPLGEELRRLVQTVTAVPDFTEFRPVAHTAIEWTDKLRMAAYRVRGTQSEPRTDWDDPRARQGYDAAEDAAFRAFQAGLQFDLAPPGNVTTTDVPAVASEKGHLIRLHRHPDGREILYVVRWGADSNGPTTLRLPSTCSWQSLSAAATGSVVHRSGDSIVLLAHAPAAEIYRVDWKPSVNSTKDLHTAPQSTPFERTNVYE